MRMCTGFWVGMSAGLMAGADFIGGTIYRQSALTPLARQWE